MLGVALVFPAACRRRTRSTTIFAVCENSGNVCSRSQGFSAVPTPITQECAVAAFTSLCREVDFAGFQWPMIEDLLLDKDILWFTAWYQEQDWDGLPAFPCLGDRSARVCAHYAVGDQPGAGAAAKATPPLILFGLGADGHFEAALECQQHCTPFEKRQWWTQICGRLPTCHPAIRTTFGNPGNGHAIGLQSWPGDGCLSQTSSENISLLKSKRLQPRHIALVGILLLLIQWPDHDLMHDLIFGFPAVGFAPHLPVYASQEATFVSAEEVFSSAWEDAQKVLASLKPGEFDDAIIQPFASLLEMCLVVAGQRFLCIGL